MAATSDVTDIYLYYNGECKAAEFIEDDCCSFNNDGTVHYVQFIEGSPTLALNSTGFYVAELLERIIMNLTDESDMYLVDESDNYLTAII